MIDDGRKFIIYSIDEEVVFEYGKTNTRQALANLLVSSICLQYVESVL